MMQTNNATIMSKGQHLSLKERIETQCMLLKDYSHRQIALELDRSHATINNEIKRGTTEQNKKVDGVTFPEFKSQPHHFVYEKSVPQMGF